MQSSVVKTIASATNRKLRFLVNKDSPTQRSLAPGRQIINNIVEADAHSRLRSLFPDADHHKPCFLSMDIAAAFPSLFHAWMWETFRRWGMRGSLDTSLRAS